MGDGVYERYQAEAMRGFATYKKKEQGIVCWVIVDLPR
jgi:hypothetical protein